jgi:hypothetical protein
LGGGGQRLPVEALLKGTNVLSPGLLLLLLLLLL